MKEKKKLVNYCWRKCRGLCNEEFVPDCSQACDSYCVNKEAIAPAVPPQVMKKWEDLYDKVMKGSDVGCQPYFAPPGPSSAEKITRNMYKEQTVNHDEVRKALLRQIRPHEEDEEEESEGKNPNRDLPKCHLWDQDLMQILNTPPIEVAYRNYVGKHKGTHPEKEGSSTKATTLISDGTKTGAINPNIKRVEFMQIAKTMTDIDEELLKGVEEVWGAIGPILIECDEGRKRKIMDRIHRNLSRKVEIQRKVLNKLKRDNYVMVAEFERGLSAELDKKYDSILQEMSVRLDSDSASAIDCLLKQYEDRNRFEIEWCRQEGVEKYQERVRLFTQFCNLWMRIMGASESRSQLNEKDERLALKDGRLIADIQKQEEHRILKSVGDLNRDHELIQTTLADFLYQRDLAVTRLKDNVEELNKKANIWKNLVNDLLAQFQKFVTFALNEQPVQTQYLLSLNELYNHFLEDYLQKDRETAAHAMKKTTEDRVRALYPTCGPPDRLSQGNSSTPDTTSSMGTGAGEPKCLVSDYLMTAITTGEFSQKPPSYDELVYRREQELEAVVQTFGYEPSENITWDTQSTLNFKEALNYPTSPLEPPTAVEEDCADMDYSTKNKVNEVLNLIHEKPEVMRGYITF